MVEEVVVVEKMAVAVAVAVLEVLALLEVATSAEEMVVEVYKSTYIIRYTLSDIYLKFTLVKYY